MSFDPVWDQKFGEGYGDRYPWDSVVSFVHRNAPRDRPREKIVVGEVGFGAGSNLWFAAREGFSVCGIEGSAAAVVKARQRFAQDGLRGDLRQSDFASPLPFADASVDLMIDRAAITCVGASIARGLIREIARVLKPGGRFFFNPYSRASTSFISATPDEDDLVRDVTAGTLTGLGRLCFYDEAMVHRLMDGALDVVSLSHMESVETAAQPPVVHAEWRVVAGKA